MKTLASAAALTLLFASSAAAGGIVFSLPNYHFPPSEDVTVGKECLTQNATSETCIPQE